MKIIPDSARRYLTASLTKPGWVILASVGILCSLGIATIFVADTHYAAGKDGPANAARQAVYLLGALVLGAMVLRIGYHAVARYAYVIFFAATLTLVPLFLARLMNTTMGGLTQPRNGAYRWIQLPGFQAQPSEFVKIAAVLALAWYLRFRKNYRRFWGLLVPFLIAAVPLGLILFQPDLGTVVLMIPVVFMMLFMAGAKKRHLALIALAGVASLPFLWGQIKGYQRTRITAVLLQSDELRRDVIENPKKYDGFATKRQALEWAASSGYQLVHSKNAIGSGGATGLGWGEGVYVEQPLLPDRHNDFIFALIGHQWGFWGCALVVTCYAALVVAGVRIASATPEPSGRLIAVGLTTLIGFQATINIAMSVGLMPTTGMTLPFVSHGGSSLLSGFIALALLISISRHRPFSLATSPFEFTTRDTSPIHPAEQQRSSIPGEVAPWSPERSKKSGGFANPAVLSTKDE